jgi:predicted NAD-dependent protein-ADP-ribosyltransferase YbiA (DUF1768 family)
MSFLILHSSKVQPFGMLSNNAKTEFSIDGETWDSAIEFIYCNMFQTKTAQQQMRNHLFMTPYTYFLQLKSQEDETLYKTEIIYGLQCRFSNNKKLYQDLLQTRNFELKHRDVFIVQVLNNIRNKNDIVVNNTLISKTDAYKIIEGVEDELLRNPLLDNNLDFETISKYKKKYTAGKIYSDEYLLHMNSLVPFLKYENQTKLTNNLIDSFKNHMLDVSLDYILKKDYPHVKQQQYKEAKQQQINKIKNLDEYKTTLYNIYNQAVKTKEQQEIISNLTYTPDEALEHLKQTELLLKHTESNKTKVLDLDRNPFFLPHYIETVIINNKPYVSVVHYAYSKLINNLKTQTNNIADFDVDVNKIPIEQLPSYFNNLKKYWVLLKITENNKKALDAKFKAHPTLIHVLLATKNYDIKWGDNTDYILGYEKHSNAHLNITGKYLMTLREIYSLSQNMDSVIRPTTLMFSNIWVKAWLFSIVRDLQNVISMLKTPTFENLKYIYTPVYPDIINYQPATTINTHEELSKIGIDKQNQLLILPFLTFLFEKFTNKTLSQIINIEADEYFKQLSVFLHQKNIYKNEIKNAFSILTEKAKNLNINSESTLNFVYSVLSSKQTTSVIDIKWQNVLKFQNHKK